MNSLFENNSNKPLPERIRPTKLADVVGQDHILDPDSYIETMIKNKKPSSIILSGPPGTGKTTIAQLIAKEVHCHFEILSAVMSGVADLRKVIEKAQKNYQMGQSTILFVDEIHRWNKSQQDALLPHVENGTIILIGATTENPSFSINGALLSRTRVITLKRFDEEALEDLIKRAEHYYDRPIALTQEARKTLIEFSDGDGRYLLNMCEHIFNLKAKQPLDVEALQETIQRKAPEFDKSGDGFYSLISALQKSIRGSDEQAALYYLARILQGGEDPRVILRRLIVMATEEIGMADPNAIQQAIATAEAYERLGSPEGLPSIGSLVIYLATSPKSNAAYKAFYAAMEFSENHGSLNPPKHIINAPTKLMKEQGFKEGYQYDHDYPNSFSGQEFFPDQISGTKRPEFYQPKEVAHEREITKRISFWNNLRSKLQKK